MSVAVIGFLWILVPDIAFSVDVMDCQQMSWTYCGCQWLLVSDLHLARGQTKLLIRLSHEIKNILFTLMKQMRMPACACRSQASQGSSKSTEVNKTIVSWEAKALEDAMAVKDANETKTLAVQEPFELVLSTPVQFFHRGSSLSMPTSCACKAS